MIRPTNKKEIKKKIDNLKKKNRKVIVLGRDIKLNREILENEKVDTLILQHKPERDKLKQRNSGLNEILCKIAKDNNIILAIDLNELKEVKNKKERGEILARIIQNIRLIKKQKNKFKLLNFKNKSQAQSFLLTLGLPTDMAKKAVKK